MKHTRTFVGRAVVSAATVATLAGLDSAEAALARDMPVDTVNAAIGAGGTRVAVTHVVGTVDRGVELTRGRLPGPGEVVVPEAKLAELGLSLKGSPVDYVSDDDYANPTFSDETRA